MYMYADFIFSYIFPGDSLQFRNPSGFEVTQCTKEVEAHEVGVEQGLVVVAEDTLAR